MTKITAPNFLPMFKQRIVTPLPTLALALGLLTVGSVSPLTRLHAQDAKTEISLISDRLLFVTSGGFWVEAAVADEDVPAEEAAGESTDEAKPEADAAVSTEATPEVASRRGYYRLVVIRGDDNTSKLFLQEMEISEQGPSISLSTEIEEINALGAYVTDVRREDSSGEPGFLAFVFLKTDLKLVEPDTWTVLVDEFGDITVEQATN